jgi:hypothetical protein
VPVKFSLGGYQGLNIFATGYPASQTIVCNTSAGLDAIEQTVTAGSSSLSYDATSDQYTYVWKTDKSWAAGTCRQLTVQLNDGTSQTANSERQKHALHSQKTVARPAGEGTLIGYTLTASWAISSGQAPSSHREYAQ